MKIDVRKLKDEIENLENQGFIISKDLLFEVIDEMLDSHDCHASPEDGCKHCYEQGKVKEDN